MSGRADASVAHEAQTLHSTRRRGDACDVQRARSERVLATMAAGISTVQVPLEAAARALDAREERVRRIAGRCPVQVSVDIQRNQCDSA
jgi:hypothetical protein